MFAPASREPTATAEDAEFNRGERQERKRILLFNNKFCFFAYSAYPCLGVLCGYPLFLAASASRR